MSAFVTAGAGFLLAVLWFDLMFDVQVLGRPRGEAELPGPLLASISAYYRRVTTAARPMNRLVAAVMLATLAALIVEVARGDRPAWAAWASLALALAAISIAAVRTANPSWSEGDVAAKAQALTEFNPQLVLDVLLRNGSWDSGMAVLRDPKARHIRAWLIRGEWSTGGFIPDSKVPGIERQLGADHVITIAGGPHSPQRTHPEATILGILTALQGA